MKLCRGSFHAPRATIRAVQLALGLAIASIVPPRAVAQEPYTISPGHEELVLGMTGGSDRLPGGCALDGASIDRILVSARYRCDDGSTPVLVLRHPSTSDATLRTTSFAIEPSPGAPPELVDAIASRVRAREAEFHWDVGRRSPQPSGPSIAVVVAGTAGVIALAAAGAVVWWWRRRRRAAV